MLESNPDAVKRYAPPSQRNGSMNRRKSADKFEKANYSHGIEGEKGQGSYSRKFPANDHGEAGNNYIRNEATPRRLIPINGCSVSEASLLLSNRWAAVMNAYNDPSVDPSEKPVMYSGSSGLMYSGTSGSSWGHFKLPHQMDFLGELRRQMQNFSPNATPTPGDRI